ncbi:TolC family protein [Arcobacter roscoffensis]|uniref:TolC family protein n=1 Tax=Arcobacter roscoffensis TaxID=2961520 RepID=A0ABY5E618_9BACT|nr:TolC family protein [Arcobacter roscoffensis]UTJ07604.1 TolC family protein [Arcobacter roscoffensis]
MKKVITICCIGLLSSVWASNEPKTIDVDIKSMIVEVVKRNSNIIFDRMQDQIIESQIKLEESGFDPTFYVNITKQRTDVPNGVDEKSTRGYLNDYEENLQSQEMGIKGVTSIGSQWSLSLTSSAKQSNLINKYQSDYDTEFRKGIKLSLVQPLLKGFGEHGAMGKVNLAKAERKIYSKKSQKNISDVMGGTIQSYWKYYSAKQLKESYKSSLDFNEKITKLLEKKFEAGEIPYSEVLEAKSSGLIRQAQLKKIDSEIKKYKNDFFSLLNVSTYNTQDIDFNLLENPSIDENEKVLSLQAYFEKALEIWPEFQIAKNKLEKELLQIKITENYVKPQLDLITSASSGTLTNTFKDRVYDDEHISWSVGLQYSGSLYNNQAINALRIAKLKVNQIKLELDTLKKGLYNAIDTKLESYNNSKEEVEFYKDSLEIKKRLLADTKKAFNFGEKSIKDVIVQEDDLIEYQNKFFNRLIDFKLSKASLDKAIGELFNKYLSMEEIERLKVSNVRNELSKESFGVIR